MLLQRVEDDPQTVHLRGGIPMSRSLVGVLDGEDSLLHGRRGGAQPSQVAQVSEDLVLILDRVTSMVKVGGQPPLPLAPIAPFVPCRQV